MSWYFYDMSWYIDGWKRGWGSFYDYWLQPLLWPLLRLMSVAICSEHLFWLVMLKIITNWIICAVLPYQCSVCLPGPGWGSPLVCGTRVSWVACCTLPLCQAPRLTATQMCSQYWHPTQGQGAASIIECLDMDGGLLHDHGQWRCDGHYWPGLRLHRCSDESRRDGVRCDVRRQRQEAVCRSQSTECGAWLRVCGGRHGWVAERERERETEEEGGVSSQSGARARGVTRPRALPVWELIQGVPGLGGRGQWPIFWCIMPLTSRGSPPGSTIDNIRHPEPEKLQYVNSVTNITRATDNGLENLNFQFPISPESILVSICCFFNQPGSGF